MRAALLVKKGKAKDALFIKEVPEPVLFKGGVKIKVEAFGLNFADVMARLGLYQDCPPLPAILGYDVVGHVIEVAQEVTDLKVGDRVVALTRFGGYAEIVVADQRACSKISTSYHAVKATALSTQYCTAWYCMQEMVKLRERDTILIHAAAGGVGTAMVQLAHHLKLEIFATAGSEEKIEGLKGIGVQHPINYRKSDFAKEIQKIKAQKSPIDVSFNSVGGSTVRKDFGLLRPGGREVLIGAATMSNASIFGKLQAVMQFGLYHPIQLMMASKSILGVNMLHVGDSKPEMISRCLKEVVLLAEQKILDPKVGGYFSINDLAKAHEILEQRASTGKIAIFW